jgi:hypothetical protein
MAEIQKRPGFPGPFLLSGCTAKLELEDAFELLLEARQPATTVHQLGIAAGPPDGCSGRYRATAYRLLAVGRVGDNSVPSVMTTLIWW